MSLKILNKKMEYYPLESITIADLGNKTVKVFDSQGVEYFSGADQSTLSFKVSGALGTHLIHAQNGPECEILSFSVNCKTEIEDEGGLYKALFHDLWWTMANACGGFQLHNVNGKIYKTFVPWLRDHTHTMKGMKYFDGDLKTGFELFADSQRNDGMVYDLISGGHPFLMWRDYSFKKGDFIKSINDGKNRLERIPVENDVEYLFVECLYYTWKATGDTQWMQQYLDKAINAFTYSTTSKYRWSEKFGLLKRGYTVDTWDFMSYDDIAISGGDNLIDPDKNTFGIMHGDNTGFAVGCEYLAEMLDTAGRTSESKNYRELSAEIRKNLDTIAWNGQFFTHHVSEDSSFKRDLGVDESKQVSLSNAYALNRRISHEQSVEIVKTYQKIKSEMPSSSPGEWYNIYPPFQNGFSNKWAYMNGGVSTIVAGELAHGAFENGFEEYGVDILKRLKVLANNHNGHLDVCFRGAMDPEPKRSFSTINIRSLVNASTGDSTENVVGWIDEKGNNVANLPKGNQSFIGVPFEIIDPSVNNQKACIALSNRQKYTSECIVPIGDKASSIYFLHALAGNELAGTMKVTYKDGTSRTEYIQSGNQLDHWFMPGVQSFHGRDHAHVPLSGFHPYQIAWRGKNELFDNVGVFIWGWDNPDSSKEIENIRFTAAENGSRWFILGMTKSDAPVYFPQTDLSFGIPDNWGAAAVTYALIEGLAGVKDTGVAMNRAIVAPRWSAAGVNKAAACVKYEASGGYVRYTYSFTGDNEIQMELSASSDSVTLELLIPKCRKIDHVTMNGQNVQFLEKTVEKSIYCVVNLSSRTYKDIVIRLK